MKKNHSETGWAVLIDTGRFVVRTDDDGSCPVRIFKTRKAIPKLFKVAGYKPVRVRIETFRRKHGGKG